MLVAVLVVMIRLKVKTACSRKIIFLREGKEMGAGKKFANNWRFACLTGCVKVMNLPSGGGLGCRAEGKEKETDATQAAFRYLSLCLSL